MDFKNTSPDGADLRTDDFVRTSFLIHCAPQRALRAPESLAKIRTVSILVNGGFSLWSAWTTCSKACGTGSQSRRRTCSNPVPADGGQNCTGEYEQAKSCKLTSCPGKYVMLSLVSLLKGLLFRELGKQIHLHVFVKQGPHHFVRPL